MFSIIHAHIDFSGTDSKMEIISRHRTREAAVKKMVKMIPSFYGWDDPKEFDEEFPEDRPKAAQEGIYAIRDESWGEWGDMLAVIEI